MMNLGGASVLLTALAAFATAQQCPVVTDADTYPNPPLTYPMTSDRYSVQYQLGGSGTWTSAPVYISYYGGTNSSPYVKDSQYPADESMSFVSIPASAGTSVALRVTKIFGSNFPAIGQMSVRPAAKGVQITSVSPTTVQLSTTTSTSFNGDQFILYWNGTAQASGAIQGLALFLNPPYVRPTGSNVKTVAVASDLTGDLSNYDTLDFEGTVAVAGTGTLAFVVPANIANIYLGPQAWVQGKFRFTQTGAGKTRRLYGPGVLDVSRFNYMYRQCRNSPTNTDNGYQALSWIPVAKANTDSFIVDGPIITDTDYYATDWFMNSTINNLKIIGWNGNNDGIQMGFTTRVSNVFIRTGDDSLKMWGSYITVTNATVWQNWNGGVINLGWSDNSPGDDCLIDGVYVVKTDWHAAPSPPSWSIGTLNAQNDAIVASLMIPGTAFGSLIPSVYRNIYVEDPPRTLFSLKILPFDCSLNGVTTCPTENLSQTSILNLNIENLFTPASVIQNSIGFQTVSGTTLPGTINIGLTNIMITPTDGTATPLSSANATSLGNITTNGSIVNIQYASAPVAATPPVVPVGAVLNGASFAIGAPVAPGSIASVFGSGFGSTTSGVTVLIGGIAAPLFAVYPTQINFQVPWQLSGQTQVPLTVTSGDVTGAPIMVTLAAQAPGIFLLNSAGQAAALVAGTASIVAPAGSYAGSRPAQQGEYITLYCTGLGSVSNQPATGALASSTNLSQTLDPSTAVSIGGISAPVSFSGLTPGFLGLYQVNVQVPSKSPTGSAVPLTISMRGAGSNQATVAIVAGGS
jgi:uncharacterized protein (TIGR03437 family)